MRWIYDHSRDFIFKFIIREFKIFHKGRVIAEGGRVLLYVWKVLLPIGCIIDHEFELIKIKLSMNKNLHIQYIQLIKNTSRIKDILNLLG